MRETGVVRFNNSGDKAVVAAHIGVARLLLGKMKQEMRAFKLAQLIRRFVLSDGVEITVRSLMGQDSIDINAEAVVAKVTSVLSPFSAYSPTLVWQYAGDNTEDFVGSLSVQTSFFAVGKEVEAATVPLQYSEVQTTAAAVLRALNAGRWDIAWAYLNSRVLYGCAYLTAGWETAVSGLGYFVADTAAIEAAFAAGPTPLSDKDKETLAAFLSALRPYDGAIDRSIPTFLYVVPPDSGMAPPALDFAATAPVALSGDSVAGTYEQTQYQNLSAIAPARQAYLDFDYSFVYYRRVITTVVQQAVFPPYDISASKYYYISDYSVNYTYYERRYRRVRSGYQLVGDVEVPQQSAAVATIATYIATDNTDDTKSKTYWALSPDMVSYSPLVFPSVSVPSGRKVFSLGITYLAGDYTYECRYSFSGVGVPGHRMTFSLAATQLAGVWPPSSEVSSFEDAVSRFVYALDSAGVFTVWENAGRTRKVFEEVRESTGVPASLGSVIQFTNVVSHTAYMPYVLRVPGFPSDSFATYYGANTTTNNFLNFLSDGGGIPFVIDKALQLLSPNVWGYGNAAARVVLHVPATGAVAFYKQASATVMAQRVAIRAAWKTASAGKEKQDLEKALAATYELTFRHGEIEPAWLVGVNDNFVTEFLL